MKGSNQWQLLTASVEGIFELIAVVCVTRHSRALCGLAGQPLFMLLQLSVCPSACDVRTTQCVKAGIGTS
jgi:hypothetical protein